MPLLPLPTLVHGAEPGISLLEFCPEEQPEEDKHRKGTTCP